MIKNIFADKVIKTKKGGISQSDMPSFFEKFQFFMSLQYHKMAIFSSLVMVYIRQYNHLTTVQE